MIKIAFFNNKGGVGKTTLSFHVGFMLEKLGQKVLFVDVDPQCNLTAHICNDEIIEEAWSENGNSLYKAIEPIVTGAGDFQYIEPYKVEDKNVWLYIGDLLLSDYENMLSESWTHILAAQERGFRASSAISRLINQFGREKEINYAILDMGPNFGALNRISLIDCDYFFIPMVPDLFSLRGSQNLGRVFAEWIKQYSNAVERATGIDFEIPKGKPKFTGYILQQFNIYRAKKAKAWEKWEQEIPEYIEKYVVNPLIEVEANLAINDNLKLGDFKNYHSLIPMAQSALKPIFELRSSDGVVGRHHEYVANCYNEFKRQAEEIIKRTK